MNKKILFITHQLTRTGAPNVLLDMILCCRNEGHAVMVISLSDGDARQEWEKEGLNITVMPGLSLLGDQMVPIMRKFDIIVVNTLVCCEIIRLCVESGTDTIWWIHEHENYFEYYKNALPAWMDIKKNVRVYGVSPITCKLLKSMAGYETVGILPFCVPESVRHTISRPKAAMIRFVCIGVYAYVKGQDILCSAIEKLPPDVRESCVFSFYGDRTDVDRTVYFPVVDLEKQFDCVKCYDSVPHSEILDIIADSDYMIIPSRKEPMPTVAVEAMMLGVPCIISDICGVTDFLSDGEDSIFFSSENSQELSERICNAVSVVGTDKYNVIANNARCVYETEFSKMVFTERIRLVLDGHL